MLKCFVNFAHRNSLFTMIKFLQVMIKILQSLKKALSTPRTKTVYRYVSSIELRRIENADIEHLGNYFHDVYLSNTHRYLPKVKYMHFFDESNIPTHVINSLSPYSKCLCAFEISKAILNKHQGIGIYVPRGYKEDYSYIKEYAIPLSEYKPDMFVGAVKYNPNMPLTESLSQFDKRLLNKSTTSIQENQNTPPPQTELVANPEQEITSLYNTQDTLTIDLKPKEQTQIEINKSEQPNYPPNYLNLQKTPNNQQITNNDLEQ